jgi:hypothetical protein
MRDGFPVSHPAFFIGGCHRCYERGLGVIEDHVEAFRWYCKAAEQLYPTAEYSLAECFKHGRGVPRNEATAIEWYTKAAKHGLAQVRNIRRVGACHGMLMDFDSGTKRSWRILPIWNSWLPDRLRRIDFVVREGCRTGIPGTVPSLFRPAC